MASAVIWRCERGSGVTASWNKASAFSVEMETGEKIMGVPLQRQVSLHQTDLQAIWAAKKLSKRILREQQQGKVADGPELEAERQTIPISKDDGGGVSRRPRPSRSKR